MDFEKFITKVKKPSRYINGEWNSRHFTDTGQKIRFCLAFPDMYELGASGLGLEILYHIVNSRSDAVAERAYAPDFDMDELLKKEKIPLFSLESRTPLKEFDVIGFSLEYELTYTNVLNMLFISGIPLEASLRGEEYPLIIGGGPCCVNPEPVAQFFDLFVLGEGEEVICEIIEALKTCRQKKYNRQKTLEELALIEGVYVPSFYNVDYTSEGRVLNVQSSRNCAKSKVARRTVDLKSSFFPTGQIVSYAQRVHDRLNIEIARGCPNLCKFCQARSCYYPYRQRPLDMVVEYVEKGLRQTGYDEVALSSLSSSSYRSIRPLVEELTKRYSGKNVSISLPSLRCDMFSLEILDKLYDVKRSGLTFALEAGTEKLRSSIGKPIPDENIINILKSAKEHGWQLVKLYFMIGLPGEDDGDIDGIINLLKNLKRNIKGLGFNVSISPFVPKAQTAFQWSAMDSFGSWKSKKEKLLKNSPIKLKFHDLRTSFLEGVFARGDRNLGSVLKRAWELGAKFDQWSEHMKYGLWEKAFLDTGIVPENYLSAKNPDEVLPWDHLTVEPPKEYFLKDLETSHSYRADSEKLEVSSASMASTKKESVKSVQKYRLRFSRKGAVRMLSHLEQIECFRKILRRSELPLNYSKGFNPKPLISFGPAISVGYESEAEYLDAELSSRAGAEDLRRSIERELPVGFGLISVKTVPIFFPSIESSVNAMRYTIAGAFPGNIQDIIGEFRLKKEKLLKQNKDGSVTEIETKHIIKDISAGPDGLNILMNIAPGKNIKPERVLEELLPGAKQEDFRVCRKNLYFAKKTGELTDI